MGRTATTLEKQKLKKEKQLKNKSNGKKICATKRRKMNE